VATTKWVAFGLMAAFGGFAVLMLAGETIQDPGGWRAVGLTAAWLVPLVLLCGLGYARPQVALPLLAVGALAPVGLGVLTMLDYDRWRDFEDSNGPVSLVLSLVVAVAVAFAGLRRPGAAGWLILAVTLVPLALTTAGAGEEWHRALASGAALLPIVVAGVLFVVAGRAHDTTGSPARPHQLGH